MSIIPGIFWRKKSPPFSIDFSMTSFSIRWLFYFLFIAFAAIFLKYYTKQAENFWIMLSAFILGFNTLQVPLRPKQVLAITTVTLLSISIITLLAGLSTTAPLWLAAAFLFLLTLIAVFISLAYPKYYFSCLMVVIAGIVAFKMEHTLPLLVQQSLFILTGGIVVLISFILFLYRSAKNEWQMQIIFFAIRYAKIE